MIWQLAKEREEQAEAETEEHNKRMKKAKDEATCKDAKEAEDRARLRARGNIVTLIMLTQLLMTYFVLNSDNRHKKIRYNLKIAIKKRNRKHLISAIDDFKKAKLPDDDKDLPKADRILREFEARDGE